jgi:hypothetical protein
MQFYVSNALGESEDTPTEARLREFLNAIDPDDEEHGAAWVTDEFENSLEFNGDGTLVFSRASSPDPRHISDVSKDRALALWNLLVSGRIADLEALPWKPGLRTFAPDELARRQQALADLQRQQDREFYDLLGPERPGTGCRSPGCTRGCISLSALCRSHHFESIRGRPCPF